MKTGNKKKKFSKAERLKQLQEEEEKRLKEEGTKYTVILISYVGYTVILISCNVVKIFLKNFQNSLIFQV